MSAGGPVKTANSVQHGDKKDSLTPCLDCRNDIILGKRSERFAVDEADRYVNLG